MYEYMHYYHIINKSHSAGKEELIRLDDSLRFDNPLVNRLKDMTKRHHIKA